MHVLRCEHTYTHTHTHIHNACAQVFGNVTSTCSAQFGADRLPAISSFVQSIDATSHILTIVAPPLSMPGRVPIMLTCRLPSAVEAHVTYQPSPAVVSATSVGEECRALAQCAFFITVANPHETVKTIEDLTVSVFGAKFVARAGTRDAGIRADVVAITTDVLIVRIQTPPALAPATLNGANTLSCAYVSLLFLLFSSVEL
jgi:hypothetical protein